jgi:hypothetical protein
LRISRGDKTPLASFEENRYVAGSNFSGSDFTDLIEEFFALRRANVLLFKNLLKRCGFGAERRARRQFPFARSPILWSVTFVITRTFCGKDI